MEMETNSNSKFVLRSRQVWAILSVALFACVGAAREMGVGLPGGLEESVNGLVQALLGSAAAGLGVWSLFRPDNAALTMLPGKGNTGVGMTNLLAGAGTLGAILLAAFLTGCGTSGVTMYKMIDGEPEPVAQIDQRFAGKGCVGVRSVPDGEIKVIVKQWGVSDWGPTRLVAWIGDLASSLPMLGGGGAAKTSGMQGPTEDIYEMDCGFAGGGGGDGEWDDDEDSESAQTRVIVVPSSVPQEDVEAVLELLGAN